MKKMLAMMVAVLMALSLSVTAFAAEDPALGVIGGADGPTSIVISPATGVDADTQQQMLAAAKALLPYPGGVNIWLGGRYMTFTDAAPVVRDGRTQAPFRAVLEVMGAAVTYDDGRIEATFADGSVMKLAIGSKTMTYHYGENNAEVTTVEMDVAPYIDGENGRTYVPVRFIGETLGMTVTWDPELWVAYIVDWDALTAEMDAGYTKFNEMMAAATASKPADEAYQSKDTITLSGLLEGQSEDPFVVTLKGLTVTKGSDLSAVYELGVDLGGCAEQAQAAGLGELAVMLNGQKLEMIVNSENGIYLRNQLVAAMTGGLLGEKDWLALGTLDALMASSGVDLGALVNKASQADFSMGQLIRALCENGQMGRMMGYMAPDTAAAFFDAIYSGMFGDEAMTVRTVGSTKTYRCEMHLDNLLSSMANTGMLTPEELEEARAEMEEMGMTMDMVMEMSVRSGKAVRSKVDMTMIMPGMEMGMHITGTGNDASGEVTLLVEGFGNFRLDLDSKVTTAANGPLTAPAAGEQTVTLETLMQVLAAAAEQAQVR